MKKRLGIPGVRFALALVLVLFLSGCFYSINPLFTEKDLVFMPELIGTWQESRTDPPPDPGSSWMRRDTTLTFTKSDETTYSLAINTVTHFSDRGDEKGEEQRFEARLVNFDGLVMLDLYPADTLYRLQDTQLLPLHFFSKIEVRSGSFRMIPWNYEYLDERLHHKKLKIANVRLKEAVICGPWGIDCDAVILTGTTDELQKKLKEIENDPEVFSTDIVAYRRQE
jgi:hypothetical protein